METINTECDSCGGTGLYSGMCEGPGVAVICITCSGTGCSKLSYTPFEKRKGKRGIKMVYLSRGRFIAGPIGPGGKGITYAEFAAGKIPE